jgi:membrane protein implicated in regulation of membrane protease activity
MELKEILTPPIIWFLIGLVFLLLELAVPGLIIFFFGIGAWIVALCLVFFDMGLTAQLLVFGLTSIVSLLFLRRFLRKKFFKEDESNIGSLDEEFIGKIAVAETNLTSGLPGKVSFKGTQWTAIADSNIKKGAQVKIIDKESITLKVTAI